MFRFRRFSVDDGRSAMKVGTDGVLLGAWALEGAPAPPLVVDVGCGCGLIALMLAQRLPGVPIEAVDIDGPSLEDARANVAASPFAGRIALREGELLGAEAAEPQFSELVLTAPGGQRSEAYAALCRDFYL